jgi:flagellar biosynthesis/type III secretory pathway protein FliH
VTHDPAIVQNLVRRAVHMLPTTTMIEIRAHPADLEAMTANLQITEADGRPLPVHWIADSVLERGDFLIATPERLIDGRADVALRSLYERLASD